MTSSRHHIKVMIGNEWAFELFLYDSFLGLICTFSQYGIIILASNAAPVFNFAHNYPIFGKQQHSRK